MNVLRTSVALHNEVAVVSLTGLIDLTTSEQLASVLQKVRATCVTHIVVDMAGVTFIDAAGLAMLRDAAREVSALGGSLSLARLQVQVARALRADGADQPFAVFGTITRAVKTSAPHRIRSEARPAADLVASA